MHDGHRRKTVPLVGCEFESYLAAKIQIDEDFGDPQCTIQELVEVVELVGSAMRGQLNSLSGELVGSHLKICLEWRETRRDHQ